MIDKSTEMRSKLVGLIPASALKSKQTELILAKPADVGNIVETIKTGVRSIDSGVQFKFDKKTGRLYAYLSNANRYMSFVKDLAKNKGWNCRVSGYSSLAFENLTASATETFAEFGTRAIDVTTRAAKAADASLAVTSKREGDTQRVRVYVNASRGALAALNAVERTVRLSYPNVHVVSKGNYSLSLRFDYAPKVLKPAEEQIFESAGSTDTVENALLAGLKGDDLSKQIEALRGKISPAAYSKIQAILKAERKKTWMWAKSSPFTVISNGTMLDLDYVHKNLVGSLRLSKVKVKYGSTEKQCDLTFFPANADAMYAVLQSSGEHDHILIERL